ncbi:MAG: cytochrome c biogenesis CcdA family protein [Treponema sp.]|nr:cytochrome c biogenesis CcdA family protein [Treponema sp.]
MNDNVSIFLAFTAGLLSFFSPCVLPLIPSWLCFLGGTSLETAEKPETAGSAGGSRLRLLGLTAAFVLGFSVVFIVLSVLFSATALFLGGISGIINIAAGIIVIVLGFNMIFDFLRFLNYEKRLFRVERRGPLRSRGLPGAFLTGTAFGAGWTPCVGPILGSILLMAGQRGRIGPAALYLGAYSLGLGLPFLAAALCLDRFLGKLLLKIRPRLPLIRRISGLFLIMVGLLIVFGRFQALNVLLARWFTPAL